MIVKYNKNKYTSLIPLFIAIVMNAVLVLGILRLLPDYVVFPLIALLIIVLEVVYNVEDDEYLYNQKIY